MNNVLHDMIKKSWINPRWITIQGDTDKALDAYGLYTSPSAEALLAMYEDTLYTCANWLSDKVASIERNVYVKQLAGQSRAKCRTADIILDSRCRPEIHKKAVQDNLKQVVDHEIINLLERPNAHMSWGEFVKTLDLHLSLTGDCFVRKFREHYDGEVVAADGMLTEKRSGLPVSLDILQVQHCNLAADSKGKIVGVKYSICNPPLFYPMKDIIHFKLIDPANPYGKGYSPARAIAERVLLGKQELAYLLALFKNQARPDIIIGVKGGIITDQQERLQKEYNMRFKEGGIGGTWVVNSEEISSAEPLNWNPKDVLGPEIYKWTKLQIINAFKLNPAIFDQESSNRAVAVTAERMAEKDAVLPRLRVIEWGFNTHLIPEFDKRLLFCFDNPVQADQDFDLQERMAYLDRDVLTPNEVRKMMDLKPLAGGDKVLSEAKQSSMTMEQDKQSNPFDNRKVDNEEDE